MNSRLLAVSVAGFLIGAVGGAAVLVLNQGGQGPAVQTSGKALIGGPFTLVDQTGKTVTDQDFRGRYMLVFFGFTHCPDICPAELQVMSAALDALGPKADSVVPIFITLDPERDTQAAMAAYVKNFGPRFVGLTGSSEQIAAAAKHRPLRPCLFNGQRRRIHHAFWLRHARLANDRHSASLPLAARPIRHTRLSSLRRNIESPFDSAMQHL